MGDVVNRHRDRKRRTSPVVEYIRSGQYEEALAGVLASRAGVLDPRRMSQRAEELDWCSVMLEVHQNQADGAVSTSCRRCRQHLLCDPCAFARGARNLGKLMRAVEHVERQHPGLVPVMVTLSVKNDPDLRKAWAALHRVIGTVTDERRRALQGKLLGSCMRHVEGGFMSVEVKRGKGSDWWHPHVHGIFFVHPEFLDGLRPLAKAGRFMHVGLAELMKRATYGRSFINEVHPIVEDEADGDGEGIEAAERSRFHQALAEVCKYAVKLGDLEPDDRVRAWAELRGRRLLRSFGCFYNVALDDDEDPTPEELSLFTRHSYGWDGYDYRWIGAAFNQSGSASADEHRFEPFCGNS